MTQEYIVTEEMLNGIIWSNFPGQRQKLGQTIRSNQRTLLQDTRDQGIKDGKVISCRFEDKCSLINVSWEQGYQDGSSAVQHDLNLLEDKAARAATLAENKRVLEMIDAALNERYDKSDQYDCGYRGGLAQVKAWLK
jgi:hypothetical protein